MKVPYQIYLFSWSVLQTHPWTNTFLVCLRSSYLFFSSLVSHLLWLLELVNVTLVNVALISKANSFCYYWEKMMPNCIHIKCQSCNHCSALTSLSLFFCWPRQLTILLYSVPIYLLLVAQPINHLVSVVHLHLLTRRADGSFFYSFFPFRPWILQVP